MTNNNCHATIYPQLPVKDWRIKSCFNFEKEINQDTTKYSMRLQKMKKKLNNLRLANSILVSSSSAISIGGTAISATGVGVIVGVPIIGIGIIVGIFALATLKMEKNIFKEIVKNEKLLTLIYFKLSSMRKIINKSLEDNIITEEEYKYIESEFEDYKLMESDLIKVDSKEKHVKVKKVNSKELQKETIEKLATIVESLAKK